MFNQQQLAQSTVKQIVDIQNIIIQDIESNRGKTFTVDHWRPITKSKQKIAPVDGQLEEVIELYKLSSTAHYEIIQQLCSTIHPEDEPWTENLQVPAGIEILYEEDPKFKIAIKEFLLVLEKSDRLLDEFVLGRYSGRFGPTWVNDYVSTPGSTYNLYKPILDKINIRQIYKDAIYASITAARNTSYCNLIGWEFAKKFENGVSWKEAMEAEKEIIKKMWLTPVSTQVKILHELHFSSFDAEKYMILFKDKIRKYIVSCLKKGVNYGNILIVVNAAAGIEHHIGQMSYNMCKDDVVMAVFKSVANVLSNTISSAVDRGIITTIKQILIMPITGVAVASLFWMNGFTEEMIRELLLKRHWNRYLQNTASSLQREDLTSVFLNYIAMGETILRHNAGDLSNCRVGEILIDLSPIIKDKVLSHPEKYTWGQNPATLIFSATIRFVDEPFMLINDPALLVKLVNMIAADPGKMALSDRCRFCIERKSLPYRCQYCFSGRGDFSIEETYF